MLRATVADLAGSGLDRAYRTCSDLAAIVFPAACRACGEPAQGGEWSPLLCAACGAGFPLHDAPVAAPPPLAAAHAFARFETAARILLIDLKYAGVLRAGWAFGRRMAAAPGARRWLARTDLIVPIPLHWRRRWRRGHNQAAVLARALSRARRHGGVVTALRRRRATRPQVGLERRERLINVGGAFCVRRRHLVGIAGARILLVDDVVTTGATAAEAAYALRRAGAAEVRLYAAACARSVNVSR